MSDLLSTVSGTRVAAVPKGTLGGVHELEHISLLRPRPLYMRTSFWSIMIMFVVYTLGLFIARQISVERYLSLSEDLRYIETPAYLISEYESQDMPVPPMEQTIANALRYHITCLPYQLTRLGFVGVACITILIFMIEYWSLNARIRSHFMPLHSAYTRRNSRTRTSSKSYHGKESCLGPEHASHAYVKPGAGYGKPTILRVYHSTDSTGSISTYFYFLQRKYVLVHHSQSNGSNSSHRTDMNSAPTLQLNDFCRADSNLSSISSATESSNTVSESAITLEQTSRVFLPVDVSNCPGYTFAPLSTTAVGHLSPMIYVNSSVRSERGILMRGLDRATHHRRTETYGANTLTIPLPTFFSLYIRHAMSPLFIFQLFCCILWALDDFAFFSFFSFFMLFAMEGMNVYQHLASVREVRRMVPKAVAVEVSREGYWRRVSSTTLVPGDVVRMTSDYIAAAYDSEATEAVRAAERQKQREIIAKREKTLPNGMPAPLPFILAGKIRKALHNPYYTLDEDTQRHLAEVPARSAVAPADLVLVSGQAVIDEALLTGEEAPQMKDAIRVRYTGSGSLQKRYVHIEKTNIIHAGTRFVSADDAIFMVLHTGFETSQGELIRGIAFDSERMTATNKESLLFMLIMFVMALIAGLYTVIRGTKSKICPTNHLILRALLVFVSVIPPDLPMQLSLTISAAMSELRKRFIYCTEPYRVTLAGKLRVCLFDKTGCLTESRVEVLGVSCNGGGKDKNVGELVNINDCDKMAAAVIGGCQSLILINNKEYDPRKDAPEARHQLCGDPLEVEAFSKAGFSIVLPNNNNNSTGNKPQSSLLPPHSDKFANNKRGLKIEVRRRFAFSSNLKRMTVLAEVDEKPFVLTKGAPEVIAALCRPETVPKWFQTRLNEYTVLGYRVIALAHREFNNRDYTADIEREEVEKNLCFAGLLITDSPLKPYTVETITDLKQSGHACAVVTGDNVITGAACAKRCGIIESGAKVGLLTEVRKNNVLKFCILKSKSEADKLKGNKKNIAPLTNTNESITTKEEELDAIFDEVCVIDLSMAKTVEDVPDYINFAICVSNDVYKENGSVDAINKERRKTVLETLLADKVLASKLVPHVSVFARTTPEQKALVTIAIQGTDSVSVSDSNADGERLTLFCGDGSNDVKSLGVAAVGVALFEAQDYKAREEKQNNTRELNRMLIALRTGDMPTARELARKLEIVLPTLLSETGGPATQMEIYNEARQRSLRRGTSFNDELTSLGREQARFRIRLMELQGENMMGRINGLSGGFNDMISMLTESMEMENDTSAKIGDASIAAPFTAKCGRISGILDVIRQGRCTLVTTIQTYKIVALQCIISAYFTTVLTLDGVRSSDKQMVVSSLLGTFVVMSLSNAKPLEHISKKKAPEKVMSSYTLISLFGQVLVHIATLYLANHLSKTDEYVTVPFETKFKPSLTNTVVFLESIWSDLSVQLVNYAGAPYMTPILKYKKLLLSVIAYVVSATFLTLQIMPEINQQLQLVPMTEKVQHIVFILGVGNIILCYAIEKLSFRIFGPKDKLFRSTQIKTRGTN